MFRAKQISMNITIEIEIPIIFAIKFMKLSQKSEKKSNIFKWKHFHQALSFSWCLPFSAKLYANKEK